MDPFYNPSYASANQVVVAVPYCSSRLVPGEMREKCAKKLRVQGHSADGFYPPARAK
jgi:hypothetical protein